VAAPTDPFAPQPATGRPAPAAQPSVLGTEATDRPDVHEARAALRLAEAGETKKATKAIDALLRRLGPRNTDEQTMATAAMVYVHAGRISAAKKAVERLEGAPSIDAAWARAIVAVATDPKHATDHISSLAERAGDSAEFRLLAGTTSIAAGDEAYGEQLLQVPTGMASPVCTTAAVMGLRKAVNRRGPQMAVTAVAMAVGFAVLGFLGLLLLGAIAQVAGRKWLAAKRGGAVAELLARKPPSNQHSPREMLPVFVLGAVMVVLVVAVAVAVLG